MIKDYLKTGRAELSVLALSFIVLGLTYMDVLPTVGQMILMPVSVSLASMWTYAFNNVTDINEDSINKPNSAIISGRKSASEILIFSLVCALLSFISAYMVSKAVFASICLIIIGGFFYSYKLFGSIRLKEIFIVKNITISLLWALVPLMPLLAFGFTAPSTYMIIIFFVFIQCFISTVMSDLKDAEGDELTGVKTFPSVYGLRRTLLFLTALNTIGLLSIVAGWLLLNLKSYLLILSIVNISRYYAFFLIGSGIKSASYTYSKIDIPTLTTFGLLALIGRLLIH